IRVFAFLSQDLVLIGAWREFVEAVIDLDGTGVGTVVDQFGNRVQQVIEHRGRAAAQVGRPGERQYQIKTVANTVMREGVFKTGLGLFQIEPVFRRVKKPEQAQRAVDAEPGQVSGGRFEFELEQVVHKTDRRS